MDELAKAIQKKYIDDLISKYPLHRLLGLFLFLIALFSYSKTNYNGVRFIDVIRQIKVNFIFDFKSGLFANISLEQLFIGVILVYFTKISYEFLKKKSFKLLSRKSDFDVYIKQIQRTISDVKSSDEVVNLFISKDLSKQLEKQRHKLNSYHNVSELLLVIIYSFLWGLPDLVIVDWVLLGPCVILILYNQWRAFHYYVAEFIPYYVSEKILLGSTVKFGDE